MLHRKDWKCKPCMGKNRRTRETNQKEPVEQPIIEEWVKIVWRDRFASKWVLSLLSFGRFRGRRTEIWRVPDRSGERWTSAGPVRRSPDASGGSPAPAGPVRRKSGDPPDRSGARRTWSSKSGESENIFLYFIKFDLFWFEQIAKSSSGIATKRIPQIFSNARCTHDLRSINVWVCRKPISFVFYNGNRPWSKISHLRHVGHPWC